MDSAHTPSQAAPERGVPLFSTSVLTAISWLAANLAPALLWSWSYRFRVCLYMGHCQVSPCHMSDTSSRQSAAKREEKPQEGFVDAQVCSQPFGRV